MEALQERVYQTEAEVDELTGIKRGRDGKSKYEMQCAHLRGIGIAYFPNAQGRPVVTVAAVQGGKAEPAQRQKWQPKLVTG